MIDIIGAFLLLIVFSWLFVIIILAYLITFNTPFFFSQERIGKHERTFKLIKFRSLLNAPDTLQERRFRLGDFLRATSLDELPQLYNVLIGKMSLIGPRPLPVAYLPLFSESQRKRHSVRPGITGLAQVSGRNSLSWKTKFEFDVYYVKNISFLLDLGIVVKTIALLLSFRKDNSLNEMPFKGNE